MDICCFTLHIVLWPYHHFRHLELCYLCGTCEEHHRAQLTLPQRNMRTQCVLSFVEQCLQKNACSSAHIGAEADGFCHVDTGAYATRSHEGKRVVAFERSDGCK